MLFFGHMTKRANLTADHVLGNPSWLFVTIVLLFSYALTQAAGGETGVVMFRFIGSLSMIGLPMIYFGYLWPMLPRKGKAWASLFIFGLFGVGVVVYGPSIQNLPFTRYQLEAESLANQESVRGLFLAFLVPLLGLWWLELRPAGFNAGNWFTRLSIPRLAIMLVALFCIVLVPISNLFQEHISNQSWLGAMGLYLLAVFQTFLVYIGYYPLYHLHHHVLFRQLLWGKGLLYYLLGAVCLLLVFTPIHAWFASLLPAVNAYYVHPVGITKSFVSDTNMGLSISFFFFSLPFIIMVEWYRKERAFNELKTERTATELALLKEQINPHFFFNTLNNLYAMRLTHEAETPNTILQLSDLMRYVIYRGREKTVRLSEEVSYLQDYLDLQTIRLHKEADFRFTTAIEDGELQIAPLLFIILLENAFKHGIEPAEEACFLHLHLETTDDGVSFACHNSRPQDLPEAEASAPGTGLANLRRRLTLLYPGQHQLSLRETNTDFHAHLSLQL